MIVWAVPLLNIILFIMKWEGWTTAVFSAIIWLGVLAVYFSSKKLRSGKIEVVHIKGRFAALRKRWYTLAAMISMRFESDPFPAVKGVSVKIESGMFGLLGPNGAGKTTLMRMICGILDQSYGKIKINNFDTSEHREELQGIIGYLPQEFGTYENLTAREFLDYQAILKGITDPAERKERIDYVLNAVHLPRFANARIGSFSGGMKQRIGIAQTLLHLPRILVVDEPTAGLDPRERIRFRNLLVDLCRDRIVIFSTHIIEDISSSCDKVTVLDKGKVRYLGSPQGMSRLAEGKVWQFVIPENEFTEYQDNTDIIRHIRVDDKLRIRCLSDKKPHPEAKTVKPNLEDSYLWLAGSGVKSNNQSADYYEN
jgi:ABC-type multidrug transport system ATPase subunit